MSRGYFVTFEGPEGSGKSTQLRRLAERLSEAGQVVRATREPGGPPIAEQIRTVLLSPANGAMLPATEALLFMAARAQQTAEVIQPALAAGTIVLCDRYTDSTLAYQGYGRGLPLATLEALNAFATGGLTPDLTILLDLPVAAGLARKHGDEWNRLEGEEVAFHERVRAGYHELARSAPHRYLVLDAQVSVEQLGATIWGHVARLCQTG